MDMEQALRAMERNSIRLNIGGAPCGSVGGTRFGGVPDVPVDFLWPAFETDTYDDAEVKPRPLSFLAQFNCAELSELDSEGLLPETGLLSFFYEMDSQRWGYDPMDGGCARVFWFPDTGVLAPVGFPAELAEDFRFPQLGIQACMEPALPNWEDFSAKEALPRGGWERFDIIRAALVSAAPGVCHKLLGWPDVIQGNMAAECELVIRGYYLGDGWQAVPPQMLQAAKDASLKDWRLLFQLDTVNDGGFELMFGDCGRIYFYIRKEDLAARQFDRVWLILQCC